MLPSPHHNSCVTGVLSAGGAKPKESDSDKLAFTLKALDMPDPFEKSEVMHRDLEEAIHWMAKVRRCPELSILQLRSQ